MRTLAPAEPGISKQERYQKICRDLEQLLGREKNFVANAANTSALLYSALPDVNWVGFYLAENDELVLGPFQGKPACVRIPFGKGVCGTAAVRGETQVAPDVTQFPGHITCDPDSKSEIVVPLLNWGKLLGVLDIDSASANRFDEDDRDGIESIAAVFLACQATDNMPDLSDDSAQS